MSGLFLNFIEFQFKEDDFDIKSLPYSDYDSKEKYDYLRKNNRDFNFYRLDNNIFYWSFEKIDDRFQGKNESVNIQKNPFVVNRILETSIINLFEKYNSIKIFLNKYSRTWVLEKNDDLLNGAIEGINLNRQINIKATFISPVKNIIFGLIIDPQTKLYINWNKEVLIKNGVDITGLKGKDNIIFASKTAIKRFMIARGVEDKYLAELKKNDKNEVNFLLVKSIYEWLSKNKDKIKLPGRNSVAQVNFNYLPSNNNELTFDIINNPVRHYYTGTSSSNGKSYNELLKIHKPFSYEIFSNKIIKIGVLSPKQYEGSLDKFLLELKKKLNDELHLSDIQYEIVFTQGLDLESYKEKIYEPKLLDRDLILVIVNEEQKKLPISKSPYYLCKAKFIGRGIPTQDLKIENVRNSNQYILNNISLNIYAKIGGTGWTIEREEKLKEELVIGIGSTTDVNQSTILGIAQVFNADGQYLVGNCSQLSTKVNYSANLEKYLFETLNGILDSQIDKENEFRLIFHLFKSASSEYEIDAIEKVISKFSKYKFKYALLHLSYGHNMNLFYNDGKGQVNKGVYVGLDDYKALLHFIPKSRIPLQILLDRRSTYIDLYDLSKQVFWFSNLSHRSYNPSKKTVTLMYPSLMAGMTEKLKLVEGWDYDMLNYVSEKLWFI